MRSQLDAMSRRPSRYTIQAQAVSRFAATSRHRTSAAPSKEKKSRRPGYVFVPRISEAVSKELDVAYQRDKAKTEVALQRAIYSEARWRMQDGKADGHQHQASSSIPGLSALSGSAHHEHGVTFAVQDSPTKSKLKLTKAVAAVSAGTKKVLMKSQSLEAWQGYRAEKAALRKMEEINDELESGAATTFADVEGQLKSVINAMFPDDSDEKRKLLESFNEAAESFKELQTRLSILKEHSASAAGAFNALQRRIGFSQERNSWVSNATKWSDTMKELERIRRQSEIDESMNSSGALPSFSAGDPAPRSSPSPKPQLKRQIFRSAKSHLESRGPAFFTGQRSLARASTEPQHDAIASLTKSLGSMRANLKAACFAKRAARRMRDKSEERRSSTIEADEPEEEE